LAKRGRPQIALDLDTIRRLREEGRSVRGIASECGVSHRTILRALQYPGAKVVQNSDLPQEDPTTALRAGSRPRASQGQNGEGSFREPGAVRYLIHTRTQGRPLRVLQIEWHPEDDPYAEALLPDYWHDAGFKRVKMGPGNV